MDNKKILQIVTDNISIDGLVIDILDEVLEPALKAVVENTSNPFDDMLFNSVYPLLESYLKELVTEKLKELK